MDERKLIMTFKNTLGNSFSITIDGYDIAECVSAKVVDSTTTEYNLTI